MNEYIDRAKHVIKSAIGRPDPHWKGRFFEYSLGAKNMCMRSHELLVWADKLAQTNTDEVKTNNPLIIEGRKLRSSVMKAFMGRFAKSNISILIHMPDEAVSPGGYSLFSNMIEALNFIGIRAVPLGWNETIGPVLHKEKPTIFLTGDHTMYIGRIDWSALTAYKSQHGIKIGLTASLEEYGNAPLHGRLDWARNNEVDFYYSFRDETYLKSKEEYKLFREAGYKIFSIQFGANPLIHYPVSLPRDETSHDLDYAFIASSQMKMKGDRYYDYLRPIVKGYHGVITGPGWKHAGGYIFNRDRDRYIYASTKVGLNIHLPEQLRYANETNERTYQLAACGVPQVTDHAKILDTLFEKDSLFIADSPAEYLSHFRFILANPHIAEEHALKAQKKVFEKYTTFHRASDFVEMLTSKN